MPVTPPTETTSVITTSHAAYDLLCDTAIIVKTRREPVQRAIERDEIPYPYKVHDTTLRPLLNITIKSTIVVHSRSRSCGGGYICGTTPAFRSHVNIAAVAMRNSF